MKHTPGPWNVHGTTVVKGSREVCEMKWDYKVSTLNANARLVAAAPEMLWLLEQALPSVKDDKLHFEILELLKRLEEGT